MNVAIAAVGHHTPGQVLDNEALVRAFDLRVDAQWILERTGIRERHWLREGETTSDLAAAACARILEASGVHPADVDMLVLATVSPDFPSPATATITARKVGLRCPAFDVSAACSGFLYGLDIGANMIRGGGRKKVLVVAAEARSRFLNPKDHRTLVLFADAAAGALLVPSEAPGLVALKLGADPRGRMGAWVPAGGAARPASPATIADGGHFIHLDAKSEMFELVAKYTKEICTATLAEAGLGWDDIDLLVMHQGNARMTEFVLDVLRFPADRTMSTIAHHGNVSGATVPLALSEAAASGRIRRGDRVLLTSVGAGYTFAAAVHRFSDLPRWS